MGVHKQQKRAKSNLVEGFGLSGQIGLADCGVELADSQHFEQTADLSDRVVDTTVDVKVPERERRQEINHKLSSDVFLSDHLWLVDLVTRLHVVVRGEELHHDIKDVDDHNGVLNDEKLCRFAHHDSPIE